LSIDSKIGYLYTTDAMSAFINGTPVFIDDSIAYNSFVKIDSCNGITCNTNGLFPIIFDCADNCNLSDWSDWSECSATCQVSGIQSRYRKFLQSNNNCRHLALEEIRSCVNNSLTCNTCQVTSWSEWSNCTAKCGGGITIRKRQIISCPDEICHNVLEETKFCNTNCCKIDGKWSPWSSWSNCSSSTCEIGYRTRMRVCSKSDCGGIDCDGTSLQTETCNYCEDSNLFDKCKFNQIWSPCSNNCSLSCSTLQCRNCQAPDSCVPGCTCPTGLVMNNEGLCISPEKCPCSFGSVNLQPNQKYTTECQTQ